MRLQIQDYDWGDSHTLHEALLHASEYSIKGGAAFAFVTRSGVKLLLEDRSFLDFLKNFPFLLVIGTDAITDERVLNQLKELIEKRPNLTVKAFYHKRSDATFHPKFCWFRREVGGVCIVGSGNLTASGLRKNWEAYSLSNVSEQEMNEIEMQWDRWLTHNAEYIKDISDQEVIQKVRSNGLISRKIRENIPPRTLAVMQEENLSLGDDEEPDVWQFSDVDPVLIAEIPKAANRWNQANFDKDNFINFFGAIPGDNSLRILLRNVNENGSLNDIEIRPSISVRSHNWRFELEAAAGISYPRTGRPIGVFIKISNRMFLYTLHLPSSPEYHDLKNYLDRSVGLIVGNRMRRLRTDVRTLHENCPALPRSIV